MRAGADDAALFFQLVKLPHTCGPRLLCKANFCDTHALLDDLLPLGKEQLGIFKIRVLLVVITAFLADGSAGLNLQRIPRCIGFCFLAQE